MIGSNAQSFFGQKNNGKAFLIPGTVKGLYALHKRYGYLPWKRLIEPAAELAKRGFIVSKLYANTLNSRSLFLKYSEYARKTFFSGEKCIQIGEILRQPELAETLFHVANEGEKFFYEGDFAQKLIRIINSNQSELSINDFKSYQPCWYNPLQLNYHGIKIFMPFGYSNGGVKMGLSLKLLEQFPIGSWGHWSENAKSFELITKIVRCVLQENWIYDLSSILNRKFVNAYLSGQKFLEILSKLRRTLNSNLRQPDLRHTCNVTVIDENGNIVTGNNTIFSMPWSDNPIFVGGVILNDAGNIALNSLPGSFIVDYTSCWIACRENKPINTGGVFGASSYPADFQLISTLLDFNMPIDKAVSLPRVDTFQTNLDSLASLANISKNHLEKTIDSTLIDELKKRNIFFQQEGDADFGLAILTRLDWKPFCKLSAAISNLLEGKVIVNN